jgi:transposase-like protein
MDITQKSNEINENKINRDYLEYNTGDNIYKNAEMINMLDHKYKNHKIHFALRET